MTISLEVPTEGDMLAEVETPNIALDALEFDAGELDSVETLQSKLAEAEPGEGPTVHEPRSDAEPAPVDDLSEIANPAVAQIPSEPENSATGVGNPKNKVRSDTELDTRRKNGEIETENLADDYYRPSTEKDDTVVTDKPGGDSDERPDSVTDGVDQAIDMPPDAGDLQIAVTEPGPASDYLPETVAIIHGEEATDVVASPADQRVDGEVHVEPELDQGGEHVKAALLKDNEKVTITADVEPDVDAVLQDEPQHETVQRVAAQADTTAQDAGEKAEPTDGNRVGDAIAVGDEAKQQINENGHGIRPYFNWPEIDDPKSLFADYDAGVIDGDAVQAYLDGVIGENKSEDDSPLDKLGMTSNINVIEGDRGNEADLSVELFDLWRQEYPIDYAVMLFVGQKMTEAIEPNLAPVSPTLEADPNADLDLQTEMRRYLQFTQEHRQGTARFLAGSQEFMEPPRTNVSDLECIVAIPVAGHQEYDNIYHTLQQYSRGDMPAGQYEIFLYLNLPGHEDNDDEVLSDNLLLTLEEVNAFKRENPLVNVRTIVNTYRGTPPLIGQVRADLWDAIALDMFKRGRTEDILIISGDADVDSANEKLLSEMSTTFKESGADVVTPTFAWQNIPGLPDYAVANRMLRYQAFLFNAYDNSGNMHLSSDAITGVSLAAYLAAGGYDRHAKLGEMNSLVNGIRYLRQSVEDREKPGYQPVKLVEAKAQKARIKSNSRRVVRTMAMGYSPDRTWDQRILTFGPDDALRTEAMDTDSAEANAQLKWRGWLREMTPGYLQDVPPDKKRRILKSARRILDFDNLHDKK